MKVPLPRPRLMPIGALMARLNNRSSRLGSVDQRRGVPRGSAQQLGCPGTAGVHRNASTPGCGGAPFELTNEPVHARRRPALPGRVEVQRQVSRPARRSASTWIGATVFGMRMAPKEALAVTKLVSSDWLAVHGSACSLRLSTGQHRCRAGGRDGGWRTGAERRIGLATSGSRLVGRPQGSPPSRLATGTQMLRPCPRALAHRSAGARGTGSALRGSRPARGQTPPGAPSASRP